MNGFFDFGMRDNRKNFKPKEKALIKRITNSLLKEGLIYFDEEKSQYIQPFKFVKTGKKEQLPGIKQELKGRFIRGARATQKTRGNTIIGEHFDKIFIPLDLSAIEDVDPNDDLNIYRRYVADDIAIGIGQVGYKTLMKMDYFTIVVANGWEVGRGKVRRDRVKKNIVIKGKNKRVIDKETIHDLKEQAIIKRGGELVGRKKKVSAITNYLVDILIRIYNRNNNRYKLGIETVSGLYLYKFKKQRAPNKKEKKRVKGKK